ncbi:MAG: hypothetical protein AAF380_00260 [Bacteroidota bacterium]
MLYETITLSNTNPPNCIPIIKLLLAHGADIYQGKDKDSESQSFIEWAYEKRPNDWPLLKVLLAQTIYESRKIQEKAYGPLEGIFTTALDFNKKDIITYIVTQFKNAIDYNRCKVGCRKADPLLVRVIMKGYIDILRPLLQHGARLNSEEESAKKAFSKVFSLVKKGNSKEVISLLLNYGADIYQKVGLKGYAVQKTFIESAYRRNDND